MKKETEIISLIASIFIFITLFILSWINSNFIPATILSLSLLIFIVCYILRDKKIKYTLFVIGVLLIITSIGYTLFRMLK